MQLFGADGCDVNVKSGFIVTFILELNLNKAAWPQMGVWQRARRGHELLRNRQEMVKCGGGEWGLTLQPVTPPNLTNTIMAQT